MHVSELTAEERHAGEQSMKLIEELDHDYQLTLLRHAVAASIRFERVGDPGTLPGWAQGLRRTLRLIADPDQRRDIQEYRAPRGRVEGMSVKEMIASIRG